MAAGARSCLCLPACVRPRPAPRYTEATFSPADDEQLREIEFDENEVRLDLTDFEASKAKLRQIEAAEREAAEQVAQGLNSVALCDVVFRCRRHAPPSP